MTKTMSYIKSIIKFILYVLLLPILYGIISFALMSIPINSEQELTPSNNYIYIKTNGVHLDLILPKDQISTSLLNGLHYKPAENYLAFGWGDENFYINTPTWNDLTASNAFQALFLESSTLMHVTRYTQPKSDWIKIPVSTNQLQKINTYILNSFKTDGNQNKSLLKDKGYTPSDDFYKAQGSYSFYSTCNSWVNKGLKQSGLKACYWTPFDFGVLNQYK